MIRTLLIPGDKIEVHMDIGPGRVVEATLLIEDATPTPPPSPDDSDPFGQELDELLAMTEPVESFVDDSRQAIYSSDNYLAS